MTAKMMDVSFGGGDINIPVFLLRRRSAAARAAGLTTIQKTDCNTNAVQDFQSSQLTQRA